jgi:hypothetical protein
VRLICEALDSAEKTAALAGAIEHDRDSVGPARLAALTGLAEAAQRGDREAALVLRRAVSSPSLTKAERRSAAELLRRIDRGISLAAPQAPKSNESLNEVPSTQGTVAAGRAEPTEPPSPPAVHAQPALTAPPPRRRMPSRAQTAMEWFALATFALVGAGWIYFWQHSGMFER